MHELNSILIEGTLKDDPVLEHLPNATDVCTFELVTNHLTRSGGPPTVSTFSVEVWNALGRNVSEYLRKGRSVRVVGRLAQDTWKDGEGHSRSRVKIVAEHVEFRPTAKAAA